MSVFSELGNMRTVSQMGSIPKSNSAYKILQDKRYNDMGEVTFQDNEFWGVLISGAIVGVSVVLLFNRYYK
jgi:hypothetical protein